MRRLVLALLLLGTALINGCAANSSSSPAPAATDSIHADRIADRRTSAVIGANQNASPTLGSGRLTGRSLRLDETGVSNRMPRTVAAIPAAKAGGGAATQSEATGPVTGLVLGEGDVIEFRMSGQPDMTTTSYVSEQGTVSLPLLGRIEVGGLAPSRAEAQIADAYRAGGYFTNPQVNITISQYRSRQISVLGAVSKPGRYPLDTRTGVLDALALAEGVTATGSNTVIVVRNDANGTQRYRLQLQQLVDGRGERDHFDLAAGDTVFVLEAPLFYIYGEVRRPDAYAIQPGMTVMQAISTGGGLTDRGSNSRIVINRDESGRTRKVDANLSDRIQPGDVIFVKERFF